MSAFLERKTQFAFLLSVRLNLNSSFQNAFFSHPFPRRGDNTDPCYLALASPQTLLQSLVGWDCFAGTPISKTIDFLKVTPGAVVAGPCRARWGRRAAGSPARSSLSSRRSSTVHIVLLSTGTKCCGIPLKVKCSRRIVTLYCGHIAEIHLSLAPKSPTSSASVWCRLSWPD